jgi:ribosomal protein S18 acetylase RimI-like enzyme
MLDLPRPYRDLHDLNAMKAILVAGRKAANGSYYVHTGDLEWWLYYSFPEEDLWQHIYLWEDHSGGILGWTLFSPRECTFDVFAWPDLRGTSELQQMLAWSAAQMSALVQKMGQETLYKMWNFADDGVICAGLQRLGMAPSSDESYLYFLRSLDEAPPVANLPAGYQVRSCLGEAEVAARAAAQYGAFGSRVPFERYVQRFLRFMRSPVYLPQQDIVAIAPDGRFAAFCIIWLDTENRVGLFEPVGAHPDFQQLGLGKAVMLEGLRRMRLGGMQTAIVCAAQDNPAAQRLYQSVGFQVANQLVTYARKL